MIKWLATYGLVALAGMWMCSAVLIWCGLSGLSDDDVSLSLAALWLWMFLNEIGQKK